MWAVLSSYLHACADGQACALGVHVDAEAHDAAGAAALDGGFLPLAAVDGLAEGVFVPDAEGLAPEVVAGEVFPQVGDGFVAGVGRVAGVGFPPLVAVEGVGVAVCGEFDVEGRVGAAGARFVPQAGERFAVVPWAGRGAHVDGLGVPGAVLCRQHRRHRRVGQVLGLVDDEQGDLLDAAQCAAFSRAEEDARPVAEAYFLLAGGQGYAVVGVNETAHFGAQDDRAQAFERVLDDAEVLGRPHDAHAGGSGGAVYRDPADVVGLAGLARDRQHGVAGAPEAVGAFREDDPVDLPLPDVEPVAAAAASLLRLGSPLVYKSSGMIWQLAPSILMFIQSFVLRVQGLHGRIVPVRRLVDRLDLGAHVREPFRQ